MPEKIPLTMVVESPFKGDSDQEEENVRYAERCMTDCMERGEAPFLSHILYPKLLNDSDLHHRSLGIRTGLAIAIRLEAWVFYLDRGVSEGMLWGLKSAFENGFRPPRNYTVRDKSIFFRSFDHRACSGWTRDGEAFNIAPCHPDRVPGTELLRKRLLSMAMLDWGLS